MLNIEDLLTMIFKVLDWKNWNWKVKNKMACYLYKEAMAKAKNEVFLHIDSLKVIRIKNRKASEQKSMK